MTATIAIRIERMSREEKLQTMETIWADLSKDDAGVESPVWHHDVLKETEARIAAGQEQIADWTTAKRDFKERSNIHKRPCFDQPIRVFSSGRKNLCPGYRSIHSATSTAGLHEKEIAALLAELTQNNFRHPQTNARMIYELV